MNAQHGLPNLTLKQKIMGGLGLIGFGIVAFAAAGIVFTIMAALFIISSIALATRWVWCKVTGKPFMPGVAIYRQQMEQMRQPFDSRRAGRGNANRPDHNAGESQTLEGEFHRVDEDNS